MIQSSSTLDGISALVTALTPVLLAIVAMMVRKEGKRSHKAQTEIHALVNDQSTRDKAKTLDAMRGQLATLRRLSVLDDDDKAAIFTLEKQIRLLEEEIDARNKLAADLIVRNENLH